MNIGQIIVIGLSLTLVLWFLGGTLYNRRRANQIWRWLEPGLEVLGGRVGKVWIGVSGAGLRVAVDNPSAPLRHLECIVALESRENLPLWLFERTRGKRDQLTLRPAPLVGSARAGGCAGRRRVGPCSASAD